MKPAMSREVPGDAVTPCTWSPWYWGCGLSLAFVCCSAGLDVGSFGRTDSYSKMLKGQRVFRSQEGGFSDPRKEEENVGL